MFCSVPRISWECSFLNRVAMAHLLNYIGFSALVLHSALRSISISYGGFRLDLTISFLSILLVLFLLFSTAFSRLCLTGLYIADLLTPPCFMRPGYPFHFFILVASATRTRYFDLWLVCLLLLAPVLILGNCCSNCIVFGKWWSFRRTVSLASDDPL